MSLFLFRYTRFFKKITSPPSPGKALPFWYAIDNKMLQEGEVCVVKTLIMAGGIGERLWPVSVRKRPKQFQKFGSKKTMIEETIERMEKLTDEIIIITTREQFPLMQYYLPLFPSDNVIFEPMRRNTAPAIALGSSRFAAEDIMVIVPADHVIRDEESFLKTLRKAIEYAESNESLVTIGITPTRPYTGYGYIERGNVVSADKEVYSVKKFHEKPDYETAQRYFQSGKFLWNSGMFVWRKKIFDSELSTNFPDLFSAISEIEEKPEDIEKIYERLPKISIDYGLMERSTKVATVPANFYWNDIGSWDAVYDLLLKDKNGNAVEGEFSLRDVKNCLLINHTQKKLAVSRIENYIVVASSEGTLVCRRGESQEIKEIIV